MVDRFRDELAEQSQTIRVAQASGRLLMKTVTD